MFAIKYSSFLVAIGPGASFLVTIVVVVSDRSLLQEVKVDDACQTDVPLDVFLSQAFLVFAGTLQSTFHQTSLGKPSIFHKM